MLQPMIKSVRGRSNFVALATILAFSAVATSASAAFVDAAGGPTQVEYPGFLMIQYQGINYQTSASSPCAGVAGSNIDTVKLWASLAQSALLAGKSMRIYYNDCTVSGVTTHYIGDLVLQK